MLELGSFWAYYSKWFLQQVSNGTAVLVEPVPSALAAGKRNFTLNNCEGTFLHAAVSDECRPVADIELWTDFRVAAETVNVDSILENHGIEFLQILHADIQGTEARMLRGAKRALAAKRIGWVFISTHSEYIHQVCPADLRKHGYSIIAEHTPAESHSVDGLIVASSVTSNRIRISKRRSFKAMCSKYRSLIRIMIMEPLGWRERCI